MVVHVLTGDRFEAYGTLRQGLPALLVAVMVVATLRAFVTWPWPRRARARFGGAVNCQSAAPTPAPVQ